MLMGDKWGNRCKCVMVMCIKGCFSHFRLVTSLPNIVQLCNLWGLFLSSNICSKLRLSVILE